MYETALFSGKNYTAEKNFTRPPVATVATNSKSADEQATTLLLSMDAETLLEYGRFPSFSLLFG